MERAGHPRRRLGLTGAVCVAALACASLACQALLPDRTPAALGVPTATAPPTLTPAAALTHPAAQATVLAVTLQAPGTPPAATAPAEAPPTDLPGTYTVQSGDTLAALALRFGLEPDDVLLRNPGLLAISGALTQTLPPGLRLDLPEPALPANAFNTRLLPDSEVVFSPAAAGFDVRGFVLSQPGFLASYTEVITYSLPALAGWQIVDQYARHYSINPRLLLALLEYHSGALSNPAPDPWWREHALGANAPSLPPGLSHQLGWAANQLNYGYYGWRSGAALAFSLADGAYRPAGSGLNAGSFAVARLLGLLHKRAAFDRAVGPEGLMATYRRLFGDAYSHAYEPIIPGGLAQPEMQLPFEPGKAWAFTGGPHPGYGNTLPWAALDFGPPAEVGGCAPSPEWVVAVRDGVVAYSADGLLELDIGGGWTVVYLHLATRDRAPVGTLARAGDRLGHPSCEGGRATAAHVHLSRRYNGEWIPADGFAPFVMSGWRAHFGSTSYRGTLVRGEHVIEACACARASTRLWLEPEPDGAALFEEARP